MKKTITTRTRKRIRSVRTLRSDLYALAEEISQDPTLQARLVLAEPRISEERVEDERKIAAQLFHPDLIDRIEIVYGGPEPLPDPSGTIPLRRPDYEFEITKLLLLQHLLRSGPVTTRWLMETAGCSYPTAAKALSRLSPFIHRKSDRRVELSRFPREAWDELLITARSSRSTVFFVDRSGQPRSPSELLKRLGEHHRTRIAVGGTAGVRHRYPGLDLSADPRLDLIVHCPDNQMDLGFVRELDPALEQVERKTTEASLVVHALRRNQALFEPDTISWADAVECLLDLHALGLQRQAVEFRQYLKEGRSDP
ncbi:MAG: hypothetical protein IFK94_16075 [Acidobacteria bacterium]|uniref:Uncharacterized protein n=1 Tax=Candidatus Polarisedimenticola svalbardensis TaxID=2886004 RepID=A0A8J6Y797_9BACT|nr:hypothetical protein [Candidatus Polarisedimenticola svalbardensis]